MYEHSNPSVNTSKEMYGGHTRSKKKTLNQLVVRMPWLCGAAAAVMEGVTVGQVFDAECILSKRPRKVRRTGRWAVLHREPLPRELLMHFALFFVSGKI